MDINFSLLFWYLGKVLISMAFMAVSAATTYWAARDKTGAIFELDIWPEATKHNLVTTYFFLMSSYMLLIVGIGVCINSSIITYCMYYSPVQMVVGGLIGLTVLSACLESFPYTPGDQKVKITCWIVHSLIMAPALSYFGNYLCVQSMIYTSFGIMLATLAGFAAPQNFYEQLKYNLSLMYIVVAASTLLSILMCPNYNSLVETLILEIAIYGGMMLYFAVAVTNTQGLLTDAKDVRNFDPIFSSAVMFMCTINLYIRIGLFLSVETNNFIAVNLH